MGRRGVCVLALVCAAVLWGVSTSGTKYALGGFGPLTQLGVELVAATVVLWLALAVRGTHGALDARSWRLPLTLGILEPALAYVGDTVGLARTSAANASVITGLESTFVVVLAAVFLRERLTRGLAVTVCAGIAGLVVLEDVSWLSGPGLGDVYVVCGALSAAAYTIVARGIDEQRDALTLTAQQFTVATGLIVPAVMVTWRTHTEPVPTHVDPRFWTVAVLVGVAGFALSFLLYNAAIVHVTAGQSTVLINLIPAFGLASAVLWLGETLTLPRVTGAVLITASVAAFTWSQLRSPSTVPGPVAAVPGVGVVIPAVAVPVVSGDTT